MPVSTVTNRVPYQGDGTSAVFAFQYPVFAQSDIGVFIYNSSGVQPQMITPMVLNGAGGTGYTINGTANDSGIYPNGVNVVFNSSPNAQAVVVIFRSSVVTNSFAAPQAGGISSTGLNNQLDYLTLIAQRQQDQVTRAIRLPDGFAGTFDTTLPATVGLSPNKVLIINSAANGIGFSDGVGGPYIPNTVIVAVSSSAVASLGGAPSGYVLQSNGSSAPSWQLVSLSGSSVAGTLTLANGGTGGLTPQRWGVVFASSATQLATTDPAPVGLALISNASSAPTFQQLDLTTAVGSSLPIANGGTGQPTAAAAIKVLLPLTTWGDLPFAGSGVVTSRLQAGTSGMFLMSQGVGADPKWSSPVSVQSGILAVGTGGTGTGTSYIQYGVVFASSATQMANTAAGGGDVPLVGNAGAAPSFKALNIASGSSVTGLLPVTQGGTGVGALAQYGVVYMSSATQASVVPTTTPGFPLLCQGSAAPVYGALVLSGGSKVSGILPVNNGGTGTNAVLTQGGVVYMSSATVMDSTTAGTSGQPLVSQGTGAAPLFQALSLSGAAVSGTLTVDKGGTGTSNGTSLVQYGVVYMSSTVAMSVVPSAASGTVLTANGSSAPTFQAVAVTPVSPTSVAANYTALTADDTIIVTSTNLKVTLYAPSGNAGRKVSLKLTAPTPTVSGNVVTIVGSSGSTIDGSSALLSTQYETLNLLCDGTNWNVLTRVIPSNVTTYTPVAQSGAFTANATWTGRWKRVGDLGIYDINVTFTGSSVGVPQMSLPSGHLIDTSKLSTTQADQPLGLSKGFANITGVSGWGGITRYAGTSSVMAQQFKSTGSSSIVLTSDFSNTSFAMTTGGYIWAEVTVPIVGWQG